MIAYFATQGEGSGDEQRIAALLEHHDAVRLPFDRARKLSSALRLLVRVRRERPDLLVMEGTGLGGGLVVLLARALFGVSYVVSSGDAVGPYIGGRRPMLRPAAGAYERLLYRGCAGFIGWSPYLAGRALTLGAPRAMTAANWAPDPPPKRRDSVPPKRRDSVPPKRRDSVRDELGIPADALVFGLVGSLDWNGRVGYCYGAELVRALRLTSREDVRVLVVGDGSGRDRLAELAGEELGGRVLLTGRVPRDEVPDYLAAIDVGSLPQSVDGVGSFRYTTKISEYIAARVPVVTGQLPLAYDLDDGWLWRIAGDAPWEERYVSGLAELMSSLSPEELMGRRERVPSHLPLFDRERQQRQVGAFLADLIAP